MNSILKHEIKKLIREELEIYNYKTSIKDSEMFIEKEKYDSLLNDCRNAFNAGYEEGIKYLDEKVKEAYANGLSAGKNIKEEVEEERDEEGDRRVNEIFNILKEFKK